MTRLITVILGFLAGAAFTEWRLRGTIDERISIAMERHPPPLEEEPELPHITVPEEPPAGVAAEGDDAAASSGPKPSDLAGANVPPDPVAHMDLDEAKAQLAERLNEGGDEGIVLPYNLGWSPYANNGLRLLGLDRRDVEPLIDGAPYVTTSQDYVIYTAVAVVHLDLDAKRILAIAPLPDDSTQATPTGTVRTRKKPRVGTPNPVKRGVPSTAKEFKERLEEYGFVITQGKKHPKITHPELPGVMMPFAATPSETRGLHNAVSDVRRIFGIDLRSWERDQKPHRME